MSGMNKWKLAAAATAGLAIAGGGAALAADKLSSSDNESQAVIDDAAQRLNVTPSALSDALKQALEDRVDAAVAAGKLTQPQEDSILSDLKEHIPDLVNGGRPPFGRFGDGLRLRHDF